MAARTVAQLKSEWGHTDPKDQNDNIADSLGGISDVTAGVVTASSAVVVDSNKDVGDFRNLDAVNIDAGASGTAGSVDVFPATASRGKLALTVTDQTGNTTVGLVIGAMSAARTITLPDPGAAASIVHTGTAAQTIAGDLTVSGTLTNGAYTQTATNIDAGADAVAGTVDIFPATTARGKLILSATDNTGATNVTLTNAAHGQATVVTIPDVGLATSYVVQSTAALTVTEVDFLDGATAGTQVASKAVIADANVNIGVVKATALHIGATGSEVQVNATPAELNNAADVSARVQELTATGAVTAGVQSLELNHATVVIAATIADAINHPGLFVVKDTSATGTVSHTLTLTAGTFNGTNNVATFDARDEALFVYFDSTGRGQVIANIGTVALS